jgi:hypothetical protein
MIADLIAYEVNAVLGEGDALGAEQIAPLAPAFEGVEMAPAPLIFMISPSERRSSSSA